MITLSTCRPKSINKELRQQEQPLVPVVEEGAEYPSSEVSANLKISIKED
jgi:hypothetical protein